MKITFVLVAVLAYSAVLSTIVAGLCRYRTRVWRLRYYRLLGQARRLRWKVATCEQEHRPRLMPQPRRDWVPGDLDWVPGAGQLLDEVDRVLAAGDADQLLRRAMTPTARLFYSALNVRKLPWQK